MPASRNVLSVVPGSLYRGGRGRECKARNEFLYDKNRLNVAISRTKCLAAVVASPALLHIECGTPEQMALVNTLYWISS